MILSAISAISKKGRAIGKNGQLLWKLPADMQRFKEITTGHPVIMGRKTWESLPPKFRPLPDRTNIIMNNDAEMNAEGATVVPSLDIALALATTAMGAEETFIIGGGQIYAHALPHVTKLYLTVVDQEVEDADTFFPAYENDFQLISEEKHEGFSFQVLERK